MKTKIFKKLKTSLDIVAIITLTLSYFFTTNVQAKTEGYAFAVSPMSEKILLNPGDHYSSSITIYNPSEYTQGIEYKIEISDYYVDDNYNNIFSDCYSHCDIKNWIKINSPTEGRLFPGEEARIEYTIDVPKDVAGGGQYASIIVQGDALKNNSDGQESFSDTEASTILREEKKISHVIYTEVAGDVTRQGEIMSVDVPSFLLSGDIKGTAAIKNTGNVHGEATYKLQIFPLFSDEEVYTNEEKPATAMILPDRTYYNETAWDQTPGMGIFNVVYTVEFEGVTAQVSKLVIKCPVWLLFIILFVIIALIMWIIMRVRANKKIKAKEQN